MIKCLVINIEHFDCRFNSTGESNFTQAAMPRLSHLNNCRNIQSRQRLAVTQSQQEHYYYF